MILISTKLVLLKRKTQGTHISQEQNNKHIHKVQHTHAYMYGKVYSCTHCGRKGHLVQYCYIKLNFKNDNVWIRKVTNP